MIEVQPEAYLEKFKENQEIFIIYKSLVLEDLIPVYEIIENLLKSQKLDRFIAFTKTAAKELIQNAIKATQKRYFFQVQGLDIAKDYTKGMENFSEFLQQSKYISLPDNFQFAAKIILSTDSNFFLMKVINQGKLVEQEKKAIENMFERGKRIHSVAELLEDEVKQKEGGGIGLSMIIVLSKSLNIPFPLSYSSQNGLTEFCLKLPVAV